MRVENRTLGYDMKRNDSLHYLSADGRFSLPESLCAVTVQLKAPMELYVSASRCLVHI